MDKSWIMLSKKPIWKATYCMIYLREKAKLLVNNLKSSPGEIQKCKRQKKEANLTSWYGRWQGRFLLIGFFFLRERGTLICCFTYLCIHWLLLPHKPWPGMESTSLVYQEDALTNWATGPGEWVAVLISKRTYKGVKKVCLGQLQRGVDLGSHPPKFKSL